MTEQELETETVKTLESIGFQFLPTEKIYELRGNSYSNVILWEELKNSCRNINPHLSDKILNKITGEIKRIDDSNLLKANKKMFQMMRDGIRIWDDLNKRTNTYFLIDFENIENNMFQITRQFRMASSSKDFNQQIPDIVIYLNGLPIIVFELKTPESSIEEFAYDLVEKAFKQIKNYQHNLKRLFVFNLFNIIYDKYHFKVGTITSDFHRYNHWRKMDEDNNIDDKVDITTLLNKKTILELFQKYIYFSKNKNGKQELKIIPGYHQYYGVKSALKQVIKGMNEKNNENNMLKKAGIFWHTQGSGKSMSMIFLTKNVLIQKPKTTTIIITDRNDLDNQLYNNFIDAESYLNQKITQIENKQNLTEVLKDRSQNGIYFCTVQKFDNETAVLSTREDIFIISDEAHRSHKNINISKITLKTKDDHILVKDKKGYGYYLRKAFPQATFIGFTGTPIEQSDHETKEIFGDYITKYLMNDATKDGFIVDINYESRKHTLVLDPAEIESLDENYELIRQEIINKKSNASKTIIKNYNKQIQKIKNLIMSEDRIKAVVDDFVQHYEKRANILKGKAMFVVYNRKLAFEYYKRILALRPSWRNKIKIIATQNNKIDDKELIDLLQGSAYRNQMANLFKDPESDFKIAIVVDMWLTGFDVPSLDLLYLDKPLKMHNLMQTVARVNRVYPKKEVGLIIDFFGIYKNLTNALNFYTDGASDNINNNEYKSTDFIAQQLKKQLQYVKEKWFAKLFEKEIIEMEELGEYVTAVKKIMLNRSDLESFLIKSKTLSKLLKASLSIIDQYNEYLANIFWIARGEIIKEKIGSISVENDISKINENIKLAIRYKETIVHNEINNNSISLREIKKLLDQRKLHSNDSKDEKNYKILQNKNIVQELIRRASKINQIKSEKLSKKLELLINKYESNIISIEAFAEGLREIANESISAYEETNSLGLRNPESAFFEILCQQEYTQDKVQTKEALRIVHLLYNKVKNKIDGNWVYNEAQRKLVRRDLKIILLEQNYPPDVTETVVNSIVKQMDRGIDEYLLMKEVSDESK